MMTSSHIWVATHDKIREGDNTTAHKFRLVGTGITLAILLVVSFAL